MSADAKELPKISFRQVRKEFAVRADGGSARHFVALDDITLDAMQPAQLLNQVGKLIAAIYPECDPALFTIYNRCGDYIKSKIL